MATYKGTLKSDGNELFPKTSYDQVTGLATVAHTGSYNDLLNPPSIPTVNNGTLTIQKNGTTVKTFTANASSDVTANITVPTKVSELTNDSGFLTSHQSIKTLNTTNNSSLATSASEAIAGSGSIQLNGIAKTAYETYLNWGGPGKNGTVSPIGAAMSQDHNANRLAFINGDALTMEYSSDGGSTWTDYGFAAGVKSQFCTKAFVFPIGRAAASTPLTTNMRTRITLTAQDGTHQYVYTAATKLLVEVSTATTLDMKVEARLGSQYPSGTWVDCGTYAVSGWPSWNDIPWASTLGGGTSQKSQYWQLRLTFIVKSVLQDYNTTAYCHAIRLFGTTAWYVPSNMAANGHIYSFDMSQNTTFPGNINAIGGLYENGTALSSKYLGKTAKAADAEKLDGQDSTYYLNYNNLTNKPSAVLYTTQSLTDTQKAQVRSNIGAGTSSFSGSYNDLTNKPSAVLYTSQSLTDAQKAQARSNIGVDTVNNGVLTIQKNGSTVATFTANQSGNATANITVPTKTSDLTNDSVVSYSTSQSLSDGQKTQARTNIGAGTSSFSGDYEDLTTRPDIPSFVINGNILEVQPSGGDAGDASHLRYAYLGSTYSWTNLSALGTALYQYFSSVPNGSASIAGFSLTQYPNEVIMAFCTYQSSTEWGFWFQGRSDFTGQLQYTISSSTATFQPLSVSNATSLSYTTTAPTSANPTGLKAVYLNRYPASFQSGYLYFIKTT